MAEYGEGPPTILGLLGSPVDLQTAVVSTIETVTTAATTRRGRRHLLAEQGFRNSRVTAAGDLDQQVKPGGDERVGMARWLITNRERQLIAEPTARANLFLHGIPVLRWRCRSRGLQILRRCLLAARRNFLR